MHLKRRDSLLTLPPPPGSKDKLNREEALVPQFKPRYHFVQNSQGSRDPAALSKKIQSHAQLESRRKKKAISMQRLKYSIQKLTGASAQARQCRLPIVSVINQDVRSRPFLRQQPPRATQSQRSNTFGTTGGAHSTCPECKGLRESGCSEGSILNSPGAHQHHLSLSENDQHEAFVGGGVQTAVGTGNLDHFNALVVSITPRMQRYFHLCETPQLKSTGWLY